jgi:hypothetical protein
MRKPRSSGSSMDLYYGQKFRLWGRRFSPAIYTTVYQFHHMGSQDSKDSDYYSDGAAM